MRSLGGWRQTATVLALCLAPLAAGAQPVSAGLTIQVAPPALPVYEQPPLPAPGYLWCPGYWAWGSQGYFWVPGTWVLAPAPGLLWTPGFWAWLGGVYRWHPGYWGPHVGFYGGVNYGFGYGGSGYGGGYWRGRVFHYNRVANNFGSLVVPHAYAQPLPGGGGRVSFNGGAGGRTATPTPAEQVAEGERHRPPTALQMQHEQTAAGSRALRASLNHGAPAVAATAHPGQLSGAGVVRAHALSVVGSGYQAPARFRPREPSASPGAAVARTGAAGQGGHTAGGPAPPRTSVPRPPMRTPVTRPAAVPRPNRASRPSGGPPRVEPHAR